MTAVYMEGFESVIDDLDISTRGWRLGHLVGNINQNLMTVPSRTGTPGKGLAMRGPYSTQFPNWLPFSGWLDYGMIDIGTSVHSLWLAGGFSVGFSATFNKGVQLQIAANLMKQITYDGSQYYWAIGLNGATYCVCYSTDLINWTQTTASPANISADATITVMGSGASATIIVGQSLASLDGSYRYSTNMGQTWTASPVVAFGGMK